MGGRVGTRKSKQERGTPATGASDRCRQNKSLAVRPVRDVPWVMRCRLRGWPGKDRLTEQLCASAGRVARASAQKPPRNREEAADRAGHAAAGGR